MGGHRRAAPVDTGVQPRGVNRGTTVASRVSGTEADLPSPVDDLRALAAIHPSSDSPPFELRLHRPLEALSSFVCDELGLLNDRVRRGCVPPRLLFARIEALSRAVPAVSMRELKSASRQDDRRVALVDLAFAERALSVAFSGDQGYRSARDRSDFFAKARELAAIEERHPQLSWGDISNYHPAHDPRSFLDDGPARDQEIFMYRVQGAIERAFKEIVLGWSLRIDSRRWFASMIELLDSVMAAMATLTRVREVGQFYKLDPYLSSNNEVRGHGTGSFSAWTFLVGFALSGDETFRSRLCDPLNRMAFDTDARPYISAVESAEIDTFVQRVSESDPHCRALATAQRKFEGFLRVHHAAIRKHAQLSFSYPAPASPEITNEDSIRASIQAMRERAPYSSEPSRPENSC